jgi:DNA-binding NtrC family response regulator
MLASRTFLVVAGDPDRLMLLSAVLQRKFINATVVTCRDAETALQAIRAQLFDAIVTSRSTDRGALALVKALRRKSATPIVLVSGPQDEKRAAASGASRFLESDRWLLIGNVVAELLGARAALKPASAGQSVPRTRPMPPGG